MSHTNNRTQILYTSALMSMFIVAGSIIKAPFYDVKGANILSLLISGVVFVVAVPFISKALSYLFCTDKRNVLIKSLFLITSGSCLFVFFYSFFEYTKFVSDIMLPRGNRICIAVVFAVCIFCALASKTDAVLKFALISAVAVSAAFVVLFLLSAKNFNIRNIISFRDMYEFSFEGTLTYFLRVFLPALISAVYLILQGEKRFSHFAVGALWGFLLVLVCIFDSVLSFGFSLSSRLLYPYIEDISTVTVGSIFTRMDALAYFAFFAAYLVKCSVSLRFVFLLLKHSR